MRFFCWRGFGIKLWYQTWVQVCHDLTLGFHDWKDGLKWHILKATFVDEISTPKKDWAYGRCVDAQGCVLGEWCIFRPFGPWFNIGTGKSVRLRFYQCPHQQRHSCSLMEEHFGNHWMDDRRENMFASTNWYSSLICQQYCWCISWIIYQWAIYPISHRVLYIPGD